MDIVQRKNEIVLRHGEYMKDECIKIRLFIMA